MAPAIAAGLLLAATGAAAAVVLAQNDAHGDTPHKPPPTPTTTTSTVTSTVTRTTTSSPASTTTSTGSSTGDGAGSTSTPTGTTTSQPTAAGGPLAQHCDQNISTTAGGSCRFASNTFYEYYLTTHGDTSQAARVHAWNPDDQNYYEEGCAPAGDYVQCTGPGSSVRLTVRGLSLYSDASAAKYARAADIGPNR